jgi:hypothetical protein
MRIIREIENFSGCAVGRTCRLSSCICIGARLFLHGSYELEFVDGSCMFPIRTSQWVIWQISGNVQVSAHVTEILARCLLCSIVFVAFLTINEFNAITRVADLKRLNCHAFSSKLQKDPNRTTCQSLLSCKSSCNNPDDTARITR